MKIKPLSVDILNLYKGLVFNEQCLNNEKFVNKPHPMHTNFKSCFRSKQNKATFHLESDKARLRQNICDVQNQVKWQDLFNVLRFLKNADLKIKIKKLKTEPKINNKK